MSKILFYSCKCGAEWEGSKKDKTCQCCGSRQASVSRKGPEIPLPAGARYLGEPVNPSPGLCGGEE